MLEDHPEITRNKLCKDTARNQFTTRLLTNKAKRSSVSTSAEYCLARGLLHITKNRVSEKLKKHEHRLQAKLKDGLGLGTNGRAPPKKLGDQHIERRFLKAIPDIQLAYRNRWWQVPKGGTVVCR